ncbi:hypothetical protein NXX09_20490 [Bacteroides uniformis]|nr:hypothetical protein [Bacteroides uniformis]
MWRADIPPSRKADIDVDYASDRRQEIKDYLEERYNADGRQRVFSAGTFTTMKLKAALKDVARVHRVPHSIVNYITAMIDDGTDLDRTVQTGCLQQKTSGLYPDLSAGHRGRARIARTAQSGLHTRLGHRCHTGHAGRQARRMLRFPAGPQDGRGNRYRSSTAIRSMRSDC